MTAREPSKKRRTRRSEQMKFIYSGPFHPLLDSRVGRSLPKTEERYAATSAESYTIQAALGPETVDRIVLAFGRGSSAPKRRRRRGGGRRVQA
jgi:hypothetical protein